MGGESTSRSSSRRRLRGPTFARTPVQEHIVTPSGSGVRTRCTAPDDRYSFIYNPLRLARPNDARDPLQYICVCMNWNKDAVHVYARLSFHGMGGEVGERV